MPEREPGLIGAIRDWVMFAGYCHISSATEYYLEVDHCYDVRVRTICD